LNHHLFKVIAVKVHFKLLITLLNDSLFIFYKAIRLLWKIMSNFNRGWILLKRFRRRLDWFWIKYFSYQFDIELLRFVKFFLLSLILFFFLENGFLFNWIFISWMIVLAFVSFWPKYHFLISLSKVEHFMKVLRCLLKFRIN
jgi:hypothetical protein